MKTIYDLIRETEQKSSGLALEMFANANGLEIGKGEGKCSVEDVLKRMHTSAEFLYGQFTGKTFDGENANIVPVSIREALNTGDVSPILPRVISEVLRTPTEPYLFLTNQIAEKVPFPAGSSRFVTFPTLGPMEAAEVSENGEYAEYKPSWGESAFSSTMRKYGIMTSLSDEIIKESQWPLVTLFMRMMKAAVDRKIESILYQALTQRPRVVFDNDHATDTTLQTTGMSVSSGTQSHNGSIAYDDLIKMAGVLIGAKYNPTHFIMHPLAWPVVLQDPVLRATFYHGGQLGSNVWGATPQFDQGSNFPLGMTYVPYYASEFTENKTLTYAMSGLGASLVVNAYMLDKANSLMLLERGGTEMDEMEVWMRDARMLKVKKQAAVAMKDLGRGVVQAKNIRVVPNKQALYTVLQAST